jgi:hypothetical protein
MPRGILQILILRRARNAPVSKDEASWFETHRFAVLLTMRMKALSTDSCTQRPLILLK